MYCCAYTSSTSAVRAQATQECILLFMRAQQQNLRSGRQYANKIQQGHHPSYSSIPRGPAPTCFRAFAHRESSADTGSVQSAEYRVQSTRGRCCPSQHFVQNITIQIRVLDKNQEQKPHYLVEHERMSNRMMQDPQQTTQIAPPPPAALEALARRQSRQ